MVKKAGSMYAIFFHPSRMFGSKARSLPLDWGNMCSLLYNLFS